MPLPSFNGYGVFGSDPSGSSVSNPLVTNPGAGTAQNNPLVANPSGGTASPQTPATDPNFQYNATPGTQSGSGIFGAAPGNVDVPNPYQNLSSVFPELGQANSELSSGISNELAGGLSPQTLNALGEAQDQFGIQGPLNLSPQSFGLTDAELQSAGVGSFAGLLPGIAATQTTSPEVQAQIEQFNAQAAAQKNAQDAQEAALALQAVGTALSVL